MKYLGFLDKAVTFSYDDVSASDKKLVEIMKITVFEALSTYLHRRAATGFPVRK